MMFIVFIMIFLKISVVTSFDFTNVDYCKKNCADQKHIACDCKVQPPRELIYDNIKAFREEVLHAHNYWRNHIASGEAKKNNSAVGSAADMRTMSYDLELEYIATCQAAKFNTYLYECRNRDKGDSVGQNLAGTSRKYKNLTEMITMWYREMLNISSSLDISGYTSIETDKGHINTFAQFALSKNDLLGCARVWNNKFPERYWHYALICNYGSTSGDAKKVLEQPIYEQGPKCSKCPSNSKCESKKYPALCGKIAPTPESPLPHIRLGHACFSGSFQIRKSSVILIISLVIYIYFIKI